MRLAQGPPGAQAPGSGYKGGWRPLGVRLTGLGTVSPMLERRAEAARSGTVVYESFAVWFSSRKKNARRQNPERRTLPLLLLFFLCSKVGAEASSQAKPLLQGPREFRSPQYARRKLVYRGLQLSGVPAGVGLQ